MGCSLHQREIGAADAFPTAADRRWPLPGRTGIVVDRAVGHVLSEGPSGRGRRPATGAPSWGEPQPCPTTGPLVHGPCGWPPGRRTSRRAGVPRARAAWPSRPGASSSSWASPARRCRVPHPSSSPRPHSGRSPVPPPRCRVRFPRRIRRRSPSPHPALLPRWRCSRRSSPPRCPTSGRRSRSGRRWPRSGCPTCGAATGPPTATPASTARA